MNSGYLRGLNGPPGIKGDQGEKGERGAEGFCRKEGCATKAIEPPIVPTNIDFAARHDDNVISVDFGEQMEQNKMPVSDIIVPIVTPVSVDYDDFEGSVSA